MSARRDAPNVLWLFCDELRADALGCYGNAWVELRTPQIDGLAERGAVFERCYTSSPVCVPSRVCMKTGRQATRTGVYHNEGAFVFDGPRLPTFVESFAGAGYRTVNFGKVHVPRPYADCFAENDPDGANQMELQSQLGGMDPGTTGAVQLPAGGTYAATWPTGAPFPAQRLTANAVEWLHRNGRDGPFLLRASYLQPHTPVVAPEPWSTMYDGALPDDVAVPPTLSAFERAYAGVFDLESLPAGAVARMRSCYFGLCSYIDDQIGQILRAVREAGLEDNTIVVLCSDHGANLGETGALGKQTFARPSQRVPLIVSWPGSVEAGRRTDLCQTVDLGPTLARLAGIELDFDVDGRALFGEDEPEAVYGAIGYGAPRSVAMPMAGRGASADGRGWPRRTCVRSRRYRLDRNARIDGRPASPGDRDVFLADTSADPAEVVNLAGRPAVADVQRDLEARLDDFEASALPDASSRDAELDELTQRLLALRGGGAPPART